MKNPEDTGCIDSAFALWILRCAQNDSSQSDNIAPQPLVLPSVSAPVSSVAEGRNLWSLCGSANRRLSQQSAHNLRRASKSGVQSTSILAAGFGHVRASAAGATYLLRQQSDDLARLHARC